MKVVTADELVWKEHTVFKGAQTVILVGDPTKAETIVQRVKFPPHFKIPPHTHPYSEVVTVLSGTYWNAMGDDMEKGVMLKAGISFRASCKSHSSYLDNGRGGNPPDLLHWPREVLPSLIRLTIREKSKSGKLTRHGTTTMPPSTRRTALGRRQ